MDTLKTIMTSACILLAAPAMLTTTCTASAQEQLKVQALFEYPVAPEELPTMTGKSNWLMQNFWNPLDLKSKQAVDQAALNHAFKVYVTPMRWADRDVSLSSVDNLVKQLQKNPTLLLQFTKAAEENLYGPRADVYIDEVYIKFLEGIVKQKKISELQRSRYDRQLKILSGSLQGSPAPHFEFERADGTIGEYYPMSTPTIIEFGDPDCTDCQLDKLRLDTNLKLSDAIDKGKVNVMFIMPAPPEGWQEKVNGYPSKWVVGASEDIDDIYDIRLTPTFYVIGGDGTIAAKNITVDNAINVALSAAEANH